MHNIDSQSEYDEIIRDLVDELGEEIADAGEAGAKNIAQHVIAGVKIVNGKPVVTQSVEYEGGSVDSLEAALCPMEILQFTRASGLAGKAQAPEPYVWSKAVHALQEDLTRVHNSVKVGEQDA